MWVDVIFSLSPNSDLVDLHTDRRAILDFLGQLSHTYHLLDFMQYHCCELYWYLGGT